MIGLTNGPVPAVLQENQATWTSEYREWLKNREGAEPRRYAHADIRSALEVETSAKCAYCEGFMNDVSFANIEHKLPKIKYPDLVCEWTNLTLGCARCNNGKRDYDDPQCQILDPYRDEVEAEISFLGPMALPRGGARARKSITQLKLNRKELLFSRMLALQNAAALLDLIERAADQAFSGALWDELDDLLAGDSEFSSAIRYFVVAECEERGLSRP